MNENIDYSEYNEEKNRIPWKRIFITLLIIVVGIVIVLFILRACQSGSLHNDLIKFGKEYYELYPTNLPSEIGECKKLSLTDLKNEGLIKNNYNNCDESSTYVNVCYLESRTYHYSANLACENETSSYGLWQNGTESDLITNISDVRFKYLGEEKKLGTKYYYPGDYSDLTDGKEYYSSIPKSGYTGTEDEQTGYKWYKEITTKNYWNGGDYSSTQPAGYSNKGTSKKVTEFSETKPKSYSYRDIDDITLYRTQKVARPFIYICANPNNENDVIVSDEFQPCSGTHSKAIDIKFTCDGENKIILTAEQIKNKDFPSCSTWSKWTTTKCSGSLIDGIDCESKKGYKYTDTMWKWSKNGTKRSYYPNNGSSAGDVQTYYVTSPAKGAIKDESTATTVYKYYKLEETDTNSTYEEWLPITDGYVTELELFAAFNELEYNVSSLGEINQNEQIRYQYQLQYRNIEG